jgi:dephospho-CoA kinase
MKSFGYWMSIREAAIDFSYPFKAVFMAGGPGSGKNHVASTMFASLNFAFTDMDQIYRLLAKRDNIPDEILSKSYDLFNQQKTDLLSKAGEIAAKKTRSLYKNGIPIVILSTGRNISFIKETKLELESNGYDTYLVFVKAELETSLRRNQPAGSRLHTADTKYLIQSHRASNENLIFFKKMFGENMVVVDNDEDIPHPMTDKNNDLIMRKYIGYNQKLAFTARNLLGPQKQVKNPIGSSILKKQMNFTNPQSAASFA